MNEEDGEVIFDLNNYVSCTKEEYEKEVSEYLKKSIEKDKEFWDTHNGYSDMSIHLNKSLEEVMQLIEFNICLTLQGHVEKKIKSYRIGKTFTLTDLLKLADDNFYEQINVLLRNNNFLENNSKIKYEIIQLTWRAIGMAIKNNRHLLAEVNDSTFKRIASKNVKRI